MTRILLVDDQALFCEVLKIWLEAEEDFQVVGNACDGQKAIAQVEALKPDIVLMDIEMPTMNGITATQIISQRFPDVKIIVLSANDDEAYLTNALQAGAKGYLLKTTQATELADTIRFVCRGCNQIEPKLLKKIIALIPASNACDIESRDKGAANRSDRSQSFEPLPAAFSFLPLSMEIKKWDDRSHAPIELARRHSPIAKKTTRRYFKYTKLDKIKLLCITIILLLAGIGIWLGDYPSRSGKADRNRQLNASNEAQKPETANIAAVETTAVYPVDSYQESRIYTGAIAARRTSELGFEQSGQIERILVDEGDRVSTGSPLAYLDSQQLEISRRELQAMRSQAVAKLREMQAGSRAQTIAAERAAVRDFQEQLELVRKKSQRRKTLYAEGAISQEQLDETVSEQSILQARLHKAQSQLDELLAGTRPEAIAAQKALVEQYDASLAKIQLQLEKNILRAPFAATISRRLADEGTVVSNSQPILRLVENKAPEARIGIPASATARLTLGSYQKLTIGQKIYRARVSAILPELDSNTRTQTVVLTLDESVGREISPGQIARLELAQTIAVSGYWLPTTALVRGVRGLWSCYILGTYKQNDTYRVERRDIEVLHTESDRVLVRGTLQAGDRIILSGTHRLVSEQLVRPVNTVISNQ
jgi:DNA-binding NarL/FixJ family response regulator/multidrug efflux pump subunit AcrA (membrane-fusion protein)